MLSQKKVLLINICESFIILYNQSFSLAQVIYPNWSNKGVAITVWSLEEDFSVMGFIVDHLDMLITEWYPGTLP